LLKTISARNGERYGDMTFCHVVFLSHLWVVYLPDALRPPPPTSIVIVAPSKGWTQ
jgi:hypothetical protein